MTHAKAEAFPRFTARWREEFLQSVEEFKALTDNEWSNNALLKQAGVDHRFIYRIGRGDSVTMVVVDKVVETMNAIVRGDIKHPRDE